MAPRTIPGFGLSGFSPQAEDNWNTWMDSNLLKLSALVGASVKGRVSSLPTSGLTDGDRYILTTDNSINIRDVGAWVSYPARAGFIVWDSATSDMLVFSGTAWVLADRIQRSGGTIAGDIAPTSVSLGTSFQTTAPLRARRNGASVEFGHTNQSGYLSTIGAKANSGQPFIGFHTEPGTNPDSFNQRGVRGSIFTSDVLGGFVWESVQATSGDNQTPVQVMALTYTGGLSLPGPVSVSGDPTSALHLVTKQYADARFGVPVPSGSTLAVNSEATLLVISGSVADGATISGGNLRIVTFATSGAITGGALQTGNWKNISGVSLSASTAPNAGKFVRTL